MQNNSDIIDKIVSIEWDMFQAVNEGGPRASCQEDRATFEGMRRAQFGAWPDDACASYLGDLEKAVQDGRNLINEKYIYMMKYSAPAQYEVLIKTIPAANEIQAELAKSISDVMLKETVALNLEYPFVSGAGRPLYSTEDPAGVVSIETYQLGELLTYSEKTLALLKAHLGKLSAEGRSFAKSILENTVKSYGYSSLGSAEAATKERATQKATERYCGGNW